jgi:hypothetical protein
MYYHFCKRTGTTHGKKKIEWHFILELAPPVSLCNNKYPLEHALAEERRVLNTTTWRWNTSNFIIIDHTTGLHVIIWKHKLTSVTHKGKGKISMISQIDRKHHFRFPRYRASLLRRITARHKVKTLLKLTACLAPRRPARVPLHVPPCAPAFGRASLTLRASRLATRYGSHAPPLGFVFGSNSIEHGKPCSVQLKK